MMFPEAWSLHLPRPNNDDWWPRSLPSYILDWVWRRLAPWAH